MTPKFALRRNICALVAGLSATLVYAQTPAVPAAETPVTGAKPAEPEAHPLVSFWGFDLTGHVDVGYTSLTGSGKFTSGVNDRVFDFRRNTTFLHAVDLQFAKTPDNGFGGLLDVTLGKDADTIAAYGTISKTLGPANGAKHYADPTQVYVYYGAAPFSIIAGKYVTNAGAEVIKSDADVNYSRSILFGYAIPFTHTGVRATYKVSDALTVLGGINQSWDAFKDTNSDKTVELGGTYAPSKALSITASYYGGKELVTNYPKSAENGMRNIFDVVVTFNASDALTLMLNYDNGDQANAVAGGGKAKWQGVAAYATYQVNDQWRVVGRGEYFDDRDGYRTGVSQKWKEATLTLAYIPKKEWELRAEVRSDKSDQAAFLKSDGVTPTSSQRSFGIEALYKF